jgi:cell division protein FtsL
MNTIKTKYNALSKNEKIVVLSITAILIVTIISYIYSAGEATGSALYHWIN